MLENELNSAQTAPFFAKLTVTIAEACGLLGVSRSNFYKLVNNGKVRIL